MNKLTLFLLIFVGLSSIAGAGWVVISRPKPAPVHQTSTVTKLPEGQVVAEIHMVAEAYQPSTVSLKAGQSIRFVNDSGANRWPASNLHPSHLLYPEFDPKKPIKPGESWIFTFRKQGNWRMHDHLLPYIKGTITVE